MGKSELITEELKAQLIALFSKLNKEVKVVAILDKEQAKSIELWDMLEAIAETSSFIKIEKKYKGEDADLDEKLDAEFLPVTALFNDDDDYTGICFHGVPGGKELNSFVAAIGNCGGAGQVPDKFLKKSIDSIDKPMSIKIFVSLACHHCPHVVAACHKIALYSKKVEAHMYDANLYPDLVTKYSIERVPMMVINENKVYYGKKSIEEIANLLNMVK